jgi:hypothetical protein
MTKAVADAVKAAFSLGQATPSAVATSLISSGIDLGPPSAFSTPAALRQVKYRMMVLFFLRLYFRGLLMCISLSLFPACN